MSENNANIDEKIPFDEVKTESENNSEKNIDANFFLMTLGIAIGLGAISIFIETGKPTVSVRLGYQYMLFLTSGITLFSFIGFLVSWLPDIKGIKVVISIFASIALFLLAGNIFYEMSKGNPLEHGGITLCLVGISFGFWILLLIYARIQRKPEYVYVGLLILGIIIQLIQFLLLVLRMPTS